MSNPNLNFIHGSLDAMKVRDMLRGVVNMLKTREFTTEMGMCVGCNLIGFFISRHPVAAERAQMLERAVTSIPMYVDAYVSKDLKILEP